MMSLKFWIKFKNNLGSQTKPKWRSLLKILKSHLSQLEGNRRSQHQLAQAPGSRRRNLAPKVRRIRSLLRWLSLYGNAVSVHSSTSSASPQSVATIKSATTISSTRQISPNASQTWTKKASIKPNRNSWTAARKRRKNPWRATNGCARSATKRTPWQRTQTHAFALTARPKTQILPTWSSRWRTWRGIKTSRSIWTTLTRIKESPCSLRRPSSRPLIPIVANIRRDSDLCSHLALMGAPHLDIRVQPLTQGQ